MGKMVKLDKVPFGAIFKFEDGLWIKTHPNHIDFEGKSLSGMCIGGFWKGHSLGSLTIARNPEVELMKLVDIQAYPYPSTPDPCRFTLEYD